MRINEEKKIKNYKIGEIFRFIYLNPTGKKIGQGTFGLVKLGVHD